MLGRTAQDSHLNSHTAPKLCNTTHHSSTLLNFCLAGIALSILDVAQPCYNRRYWLTGCETPSHLLRIQTHVRFKRTLIYYDTDTQSSNFWGNPLCQTTKRHLTVKGLKTMKNDKSTNEKLFCFSSHFYPFNCRLSVVL